MLEAPCALAPQNIVDVRPVVRGRHFWTTRELALIKEYYPTGGVAACLDHLPNRTTRAIYMQAGILGLKSPRTNRPRRQWATTDHIDECIRREWTKGGRGLTDRVSRMVMRPPSWCSTRARQLGLAAPRLKPASWTKEEDDLLRRMAGRHLKTISRAIARLGTGRTETAIKVRMKRLDLSTGMDGESQMSARQAAQLMGVDSKTIGSWIERGLLKSKRRGTARTAQQGGDMHVIRPQDLRAFIIEHPAHVDVRKVEKYWFIDLLAGRAHRD